MSHYFFWQTRRIAKLVSSASAQRARPSTATTTLPITFAESGIDLHILAWEHVSFLIAHRVCLSNLMMTDTGDRNQETVGHAPESCKCVFLLIVCTHLTWWQRQLQVTGTCKRPRGPNRSLNSVFVGEGKSNQYQFCFDFLVNDTPPSQIPSRIQANGYQTNVH